MFKAETEWWKNELANDIHEVLRKKESTLAQYKGSSPQLAIRRYLVDWLAIIFEKIGSSYGILHLSVSLMDFFMDNHDIPEPQLHLVALTCFLLAGTDHVVYAKIVLISKRACNLSLKRGSIFAPALVFSLYLTSAVLTFYFSQIRRSWTSYPHNWTAQLLRPSLVWQVRVSCNGVAFARPFQMEHCPAYLREFCRYFPCAICLLGWQSLGSTIEKLCQSKNLCQEICALFLGNFLAR